VKNLLKMSFIVKKTQACFLYPHSNYFGCKKEGKYITYLSSPFFKKKIKIKHARGLGLQACACMTSCRGGR